MCASKTKSGKQEGDMLLIVCELSHKWEGINLLTGWRTNPGIITDYRFTESPILFPRLTTLGSISQDWSDDAVMLVFDK